MVHDQTIKSNYIFVYGSLLREAHNHQLLHKQGAVSYIGSARIKGKLYLIDWYPGFVPGEEGSVYGEVFEMHSPNFALPFLDEYEGIGPGIDEPEYERVLIEVNVNDESYKCWTYSFIHDTQNFPQIPDGDFRTYLKSKR